MIRRRTLPIVLAPALIVGCATHRDVADQATLAELRHVEPDVREAEVDQGLEQAMEGYRRFLEETPETKMTPEAMRRLADLEIEKQFGIHTGDGTPGEMVVPESAPAPANAWADTAGFSSPLAAAGPRETDREFELRTTAPTDILTDSHAGTSPADAGPTGRSHSEPTEPDTDPTAALEAIALYDELLGEYPDYEHADEVLYQKARAYAELGRTDEAMETMERLIRANPHSEHYDEVQFRRGEYFFTRRRYLDAENAYSAIIGLGEGSSYYELGLYKLGWALYKQELYEEALHRYIALLDYKVSIGYDFDATHEEDDERRVADTFRVISLGFSNLGGADAVREYFSSFGNRSYEDRVYSNLGEHYLAKLRYDDAAKTYKTFVALYPYHRESPGFSMRVVDTFTKGGFPKLVLEAKRDFATTYGLQAEYWHHFTPEDAPEVLSSLKANLKDLATHYHAQYQAVEDTEDPGRAEEKRADFLEARRWYGDYLDSFPTGDDTPSINYRLADLLLENEDFGEAAAQYERTAYDYPAHEQSAAAGYAAVYAHRRQLESAEDALRDDVRRETVASSLRFADAFPDHEQAAAVLGAAADDLYEMQDYDPAVTTAQRVLDCYPSAEPAIGRAAWIVVAHGSFELADYPRAEQAYTRVLEATPEDDESRTGFVDNLAASIYEQGELANEAQDYRAAADHFLRIRSAAPTSTIRPTAEYDAGAALIRLEAWSEAASVLEAFRDAYPEHELRLEATKQIANAYREDGRLARAADEYDRLATDSDDPQLRGEALLMAGDLYERSEDRDRALEVYRRYVDEFPQPVETALETRSKMAEIYKATPDEPLYLQELSDIVRIDAQAGPDRTARTRTLGGRSALVLAERLYGEFTSVRLTQPFDVSLKDKQQRMDAAIGAMERLVDYEIADVTAAATFYIAEAYLDFSRSLARSERPTDLTSTELAEYEMALDEEAFPFEEKAIDFHEKNLELLQAGVFDEWTEKSLDKLAELVPGRYAKNEMGSEFIGTIETYVYLSPASQFVGPLLDRAAVAPSGEESVETSRLTPVPPDDGEVNRAKR